MAPKSVGSKRRKAANNGRGPKAKPRRAPAGKGGVAMGRTVGLEFGGVAPRKRKAKSTDKGARRK